MGGGDLIPEIGPCAIAASHPLTQQVALVLLGARGAGLGQPVLDVGTLGQDGVRLAVLLLLQRSLERQTLALVIQW